MKVVWLALAVTCLLSACADYRAELNKEIDRTIKLGLDCKVYVELPESRGGALTNAKLYDCVRRTEAFTPPVER